MSTGTKSKRPKIADLPNYKPPQLRQLKVTAFFGRQSIGQSETIPAIKDSLNDSLESPEVTICDSGDSDCEEIFCSDNIKKKTQTEPEKVKRKYDDADFVEFDTFNYNDETITDKKTSKERRRCPFYKRIPYTNICVDAFNFAKEDQLKHYFLSHFHADHYIGLTKGFDRPIYCSPITGRLVKYKFKVAGKYIKTFELNQPFYVNNIRCTFYDANHCPGAVIILFELPNMMRYLHTGDFRACPEMEIYDFKCAPMDCCFLDTTFCDKTKTFPSQAEVLENTVNVCRYALKMNPRTLIVCGSYCIGKEKVFMAVAEALDLKVWCNKSKRGYFECIQDPKLDAVLVDKQEDAKIHVLPLKCLWKKGMRDYLQKHFDHFDAIVALRPSGWEYKRNKHMVPEVEGNIAIYPVPYSEHSSYTDLQRFMLWLRPRRIIPTVNMGDPIKRGQMNNIFKQWQRTPFVSQPALTQPTIIEKLGVTSQKCIDSIDEPIELQKTKEEELQKVEENYSDPPHRPMTHSGIKSELKEEDQKHLISVGQSLMTQSILKEELRDTDQKPKLEALDIS